MTKWIKVQHKCPDTDRRVLIYRPYFKDAEDQALGMNIGFYKDKNWHIELYANENSMKRYKNILPISHWAELPRKPE